MTIVFRTTLERSKRGLSTFDTTLALNCWDVCRFIFTERPDISLSDLVHFAQTPQQEKVCRPSLPLLFFLFLSYSKDNRTRRRFIPVYPIQTILMVWEERTSRVNKLMADVPSDNVTEWVLVIKKLIAIKPLSLFSRSTRLETLPQLCTIYVRAENVGVHLVPEGKFAPAIFASNYIEHAQTFPAANWGLSLRSLQVANIISMVIIKVGRVRSSALHLNCEQATLPNFTGNL